MTSRDVLYLTIAGCLALVTLTFCFRACSNDEQFWKCIKSHPNGDGCEVLKP